MRSLSFLSLVHKPQAPLHLTYGFHHPLIPFTLIAILKQPQAVFFVGYLPNIIYSALQCYVFLNITHFPLLA